MPDYFWIALASVVSLAAGFASGYWVSRQRKIEELEDIHHWVVRLAEKSKRIEILLVPHAARAQSKHGTVVSTPASTRRLIRDVQNIIDRLEGIASALVRQEFNKVGESQGVSVGFTGGEEETFRDAAPAPLSESQVEPPVEGENFNFTAPTQPISQEPYARIIQLYNLGVDDRAARDRFRNEYTITRIGNNKAVAQRLGEVSSPEFRKLDNGNFLAVPDARGSFYVLPWFDSTLNSSAYNEGGFDHVFFCPGYDPETAYTVVRVRRPAVFRQDGDAWVRVEKGELILQR